ncbi:MAG: type II secretion system protein GspN, partial [Desulfatiglandales bacterium]|nr:type II secretion system protein GspN [Desulfatiglandales bacterium]
ISYGIQSGDIRMKDGFRSLTLGPDYIGLLKGYLPIEIKGSMARGSFHVKTGVSVKSGLEASYLTIRVDDLFLEDLNILTPFLRRNIKGKMKSEIKVKGDLTDPTKITGGGHFNLEKGSIGTRIDLPGLEKVPFDSISLGFTFKNGTVTLNKGDMDGPMFSGNFYGEIQWKKKMADSRLKITAKLNPGPLLKNNQLARQFFRKGKRENVPLIIKIGGTLKNHSIKWSKN